MATTVPPAPNPVAVEPTAPYVPLLRSTEPALGRTLPGIQLGTHSTLDGSTDEAGTRSRLTSEAGLFVSEENLTVRAQMDAEGKLLTGLVFQFATAGELEKATEQWAPPVLVRHGTQCARLWLGAHRLRARVMDRVEVSPYAPCPAPTASSKELVLEEFWSFDDFFPLGNQGWGFEGPTPLLGQSIDTLPNELRERLHLDVRVASASTAAYLLLAPLDTSADPTRINLGLTGNRIHLLDIETAEGKADGLARERAETRIADKWGSLQVVEPHVRLATAGAPRIEINLLGDAVRSIVQRDPELCPLETNAQRESAIQTLGARWIEKRQANSSPALASSGAPTPPDPLPVFVNRGYRLGRSPGALVHERVLQGGCQDRYWTLKRHRSECGTEFIEETLWSNDCCNPSDCGGSAKLWMLRMYNAVQGRDVRQLRPLINPTGKLHIHSIYGSKPITVTRDAVTLDTIAHFPDWTPHSDGTECSTDGESRTVCVAGPPAYRMHFYWIGTDEKRYLSEIRVDTK